MNQLSNNHLISADPFIRDRVARGPHRRPDPHQGLARALRRGRRRLARHEHDARRLAATALARRSSSTSSRSSQPGFERLARGDVRRARARSSRRSPCTSRCRIGRIATDALAPGPAARAATHNAAHERLRRQELHRRRVAARGERPRTFEQRNPAFLHEVTGTFADSAAADVDAAIAAAQAAFPAWRALSPLEAQGAISTMRCAR